MFWNIKSDKHQCRVLFPCPSPMMRAEPCGRHKGLGACLHAQGTQKQSGEEAKARPHACPAAGSSPGEAMKTSEYRQLKCLSMVSGPCGPCTPKHFKEKYHDKGTRHAGGNGSDSESSSASEHSAGRTSRSSAGRSGQHAKGGRIPADSAERGGLAGTARRAWGEREVQEKDKE